MRATTGERLRCVALRKDGRPCRAFASTADGRCVLHGPRASEVHALGGAATSHASRAEKLLPSHLRVIASGLENAFARVLLGQLDTRRAVAAASVARALVALYQAGEHEERIRFLEQQARDQGLFTDRHGNHKGGPIQWPTTTPVA